jgi:hypothetical protein
MTLKQGLKNLRVKEEKMRDERVTSLLKDSIFVAENEVV